MSHMTIHKMCESCKESYQLSVRNEDYADWKNGKTIQHAMPYIPIDARELLINGICGKCFKGLFY